MKPPESLFFDSNVYIQALRSPEYQKKVEPFFRGAYQYVINKIVLMELWAGVSDKAEETILKQHQKVITMIGLSDDHFITAGQIMNRMRHESAHEPKVRRRLTWDLLIALSAKQNRAVVVTANEDDFKKIKKFVDFEYLVAD